ncbi:2Fe-2S iron-sulfur cluster-binding protein [Crocosphaera sp. XPORK-15E]|uniref:2Fe-2S iron-sulfur cluster-binding protein n=1 Tax=Crocosphaera sp. XPORK-15E TaxID=3110247 RepID=UPI002B20BC20|nr:2Fe-2S iron-sulfur cluster-binding protein [Crocosphaera sp. XPORK-15E]MEA5533876.1 2Fe-2S iron-sulfur cluster-binding protein [Crocosphaera sp. XPORK-15E]
MNEQNTAFNVTLINPKKELHKTIKVAADEYILDMAEQEGIKHPCSCRAAACFDCLAKVIEGKVEQSGKALSFLRPHEIKEGYVLLCAASPTSNCTILTHQEEEYLA